MVAMRMRDEMLSILRKLVPNFVRRRVTASPASMMYWASLTTSKFDDGARPTVGPGPLLVPNVMTRVPFSDEATSLVGCALAKRETAGSADAAAARCRNRLR